MKVGFIIINNDGVYIFINDSGFMNNINDKGLEYF